LVIVVGVGGVAQDNSSKPISIQAGIAVFNDPANDPLTIVEFPFSVKRNQFDFILVAETNQYRATIFAELVLSDTLGNHIDSTSTYFYTQATSLEEAQDDDIKLFNNLSLSVESGIYKARLNVLDVTSKKKGSFIYDIIEIDPLIFDRPSLSSIELAYSIRSIDDTLGEFWSHLTKNGREIIPNPMGIISESDSVLFVYAELYNLSYTSNSPDSFALAYRIYNLSGEIYHNYGEYTIGKPGPTAVITNALDINGWDPGKYELRLTATDKTSGLIAESAKQFVIIPLSGKISDFVATSYSSPLDTAGLETKTNWIRFLVDPADWVTFGSLNETGKAEFISRHFREKDPTPGTEENEYLEDVLNRFNYSNQHFSSLPDINDGWRSDRGRVLLQYGACNKMEDAFMPSGSVPLQIWHYYFIDGGVYFVFQDLEEYGNFKLVHSNKSGEVYDSDWEEWVQSNGMNSEFSPKRGTKSTLDPLN